jgi:hypothetical protein
VNRFVETQVNPTGPIQRYNTALDWKIHVRKKLIRNIENLQVLEVFAGPGELYRAVYARARRVLGFEIDQNIPAMGRTLLYGPALTLIERIGTGLQDFDIVDLDAFNDPWAELEAILPYVTKDSWLLFMTESLGRTLAWSKNVQQAAGEWKSEKLPRDRFGVFRFMLHQMLSKYGYEIDWTDSTMIQKTHQPRSIFGGFRIRKVRPDGQTGPSIPVRADIGPAIQPGAELVKRHRRKRRKKTKAKPEGETKSNPGGD